MRTTSRRKHSVVEDQLKSINVKLGVLLAIIIVIIVVAIVATVLTVYYVQDFIGGIEIPDFSQFTQSTKIGIGKWTYTRH